MPHSPALPSQVAQQDAPSHDGVLCGQQRGSLTFLLVLHSLCTLFTFSSSGSARSTTLTPFSLFLPFPEARCVWGECGWAWKRWVQCCGEKLLVRLGACWGHWATHPQVCVFGKVLPNPQDLLRTGSQPGRG